jgi:hypothetical protein
MAGPPEASPPAINGPPPGPEEPSELPEPPRSLIGLVLSPRSQAIAGPGSLALILFGALGTLAGESLGMPRPELIGLLGLAFGVAFAGVAITLGILLLVSRSTPFRRAAALSIGCGCLVFVAAGPVFLWMLGATGAR